MLACSELYLLPRARRGGGDGGHERQLLEERPARGLGRPGGGVPDAGKGLVALGRRHQVGRVVADVADLGRHPVGHAVLHERVPLLRELRAEVRVVGAHVAAGRRPRNELREAGSRSPGSGRGVEGDGRLEEERRVQRQPEVRAGAFHELRDAVAAAEDQPVARAPGEADARLEALVVGLVERAVLEAAVAGEDLLAGHDVEVGLPVVLLHQRRRVGPAQARVQGEGRRHLEVVLDEERRSGSGGGSRGRSGSPPPRPLPDTWSSRKSANCEPVKEPL